MIGSIISGLIGQGGANAAAGMATNAAKAANQQAQSQAAANRSDLSPWMATGTNALGQIGALMGFGSLWNRGGQGATYNWEANPAAQGNAQAQLASYIAATNPAVPNFNAVAGDTFEADPGYQFRLSEGIKGLDRSAAAKGRLYSGAQMKGINDYAQGQASQTFGDWANRYLQSRGLTFNAQQGQYRNAISDLFQQAGMGQSAASGLAGVNSGLTSNANNALLTGAVTAGNDVQAGANALASGIGKGINNTLMGGALINPWGIFNNSILGGGPSGYRGTVGGGGGP